MTQPLPMIPAGGEKVVYSGKIIEVVQQEMIEVTGKKTFEWARRSPGTRSIVVDEKSGRMLLTREYRRETGNTDSRLPGGKVFNTLAEYSTALQDKSELDAVARDAAKRELKQEAGIEADTIKLFYTSKNGATVDWTLYYFLVTKFSEVNQELESGENSTIEWVDFDTVRELCVSGKMQEDRSVGVLLRYLLQRQQNECC